MLSEMQFLSVRRGAAGHHEDAWSIYTKQLIIAQICFSRHGLNIGKNDQQND